jgi:hypothetical protein
MRLTIRINNDKQTGHAASPASRSGRRWLIAAALAVAVSAAGANFADVGAGLLSHAGHAGHMALDPAAMASHIDKMVEHLPGDASADQKARLAASRMRAVA